MANYDNPNGFKPIGNEKDASRSLYTASATITEGDLLAMSGGQVLPYVEGTHTEACGVAAYAAESGDSVLVYDDPKQEFSCQVATGVSYAKASHDGEYFEVSGATGAQELDLSSSANATVMLKRHYPVSGSLDVGAHARVLCQIAKHHFGSDSLYGGAAVSSLRVPSISVGSEDTNVIPVTIQLQDADENDIAEVSEVKIEIYDSDMVLDSAAFHLGDGGSGTEVTATDKAVLIMTSDASGEIVVDATDAVGASGESCQLIATVLGQSGGSARATVTFD
jgi:hypothetical protein